MEASLFSYLNTITGITDLVGDRIYPHHIPQEQSEFPLLTFQRISTTHDHVLTGAAGMAQARFQFDCWGLTPDDVSELAEACRQALQGFIGTMEGTEVFFIKLDNDFSMDEAPEDGSDQWLYRRVMDFFIKYRESIPTP